MQVASRDPSLSGRIPTAGGGRALQSGAGGWCSCWCSCWWRRWSGCVLHRYPSSIEVLQLATRSGKWPPEYQCILWLSQPSVRQLTHFIPFWDLLPSVLYTDISTFYYIWRGKESCWVIVLPTAWSGAVWTCVVQHKSGSYFGGKWSPEYLSDLSTLFVNARGK